MKDVNLKDLKDQLKNGLIPPAPLLGCSPARQEGEHGREGDPLAQALNHPDHVEEVGRAVGVVEAVQGSQRGQQREHRRHQNS